MRVGTQCVSQVTGKAVAHPELARLVPVVGPGLFLGIRTGHGKHTRHASDGIHYSLGIAWFGNNEQLTESSGLLHLADRLLHELAGEAFSCRLVAPLEFIESSVIYTVSVTAPVQHHIIAGIGRQYYRQAVAALPLEYVSNVSNGQFGGIIVYLRSLHQVLTAHTRTDHTRFGVPVAVGNRTVGNENDMVIVKSATAQMLIDV